MTEMFLQLRECFDKCQCLPPMGKWLKPVDIFLNLVQIQQARFFKQRALTFSKRRKLQKF
jgi:hypothetical protein